MNREAILSEILLHLTDSELLTNVTYVPPTGKEGDKSLIKFTTPKGRRYNLTIRQQNEGEQYVKQRVKNARVYHAKKQLRQAHPDLYEVRYFLYLDQKFSASRAANLAYRDLQKAYPTEWQELYKLHVTNFTSPSAGKDLYYNAFAILREEYRQQFDAQYKFNKAANPSQRYKTQNYSKARNWLIDFYNDRYHEILRELSPQ